MKIRTDFVTNSSSSSFSALLYGIDSEKKICYSGAAGFPDEVYDEPVAIKGGSYEGPIDVGDNIRMESGSERIETLEDLLLVFRSLKDYYSYNYEEDEEDDDEDEGSKCSGEHDDPTYGEKGDLCQAATAVWLTVEKGYGESDIGIFDSGNEQFESLRSQYTFADASGNKAVCEAIIDETICFFHDLPEWFTDSLAHDGDECLLFISDRSMESSEVRGYYEKLLKKGIEDPSVFFYKIAFIDLNPFAVKKIARVLSWEWIDDEKMEELLDRLQQREEELK